MDFKQKTKQSYEATAAEYAKNVVDLAPMESIICFTKLIPPQGHILDMGSGSGRDAKTFCDFGYQVTGIDFCENLVVLARNTAPQAHFHVMDIEQLDFPPETFDGIWASSALPHIFKDNLPAVLQKVYTCLKMGGTFFFNLKKGEGELCEQDSRYEGNHEKYWAYYSKEEIQILLEQTRFSLIEISLSPKIHAYNTHDLYRVYCTKQ